MSDEQLGRHIQQPPADTLDAATRARIEAEERYHASLRSQLQQVPAAPPVQHIVPVPAQYIHLDRQGGPQCPQCGSHDTKFAKAIYEEGRGTFTAATVGASRGGGLGVAGTVGASQSELSRRFAPPTLSDTAGPTVLAIFAGLIGILCLLNALIGQSGGAFVFAVIFGFVVFIAVMVIRGRGYFNRIEYPKLMHQWQRTLRCQRCSSVFIQ